MVMSDDLTYADLFATLEEAAVRLGRPVNPTVYTRQELAMLHKTAHSSNGSGASPQSGWSGGKVPSPPDALCGPGKSLRLEPPDPAEIAGLQHSGLARLADTGNPSNSLESRFDLAYDAAHALRLAALRWHGYRANQRYIVF